MDKKVFIEKLGQLEAPKVSSSKPEEKPITAGRKRTMRTFPKGILKGVKDPSRSPPLKQGMQKHTIRMLTDKGSRKYKKTIRRKIDKLSDQKVKDLVEKNGLLKNKDTPVSIMRQMVEGGAVAGFISLD